MDKVINAKIDAMDKGIDKRRGVIEEDMKKVKVSPAAWPLRPVVPAPVVRGLVTSTTTCKLQDESKKQAVGRDVASAALCARLRGVSLASAPPSVRRRHRGPARGPRPEPCAALLWCCWSRPELLSFQWCAHLLQIGLLGASAAHHATPSATSDSW